MKHAWAHTEGAVAVEYLIAFVPVLLFFASVWQLADAYAVQLIVRRAASAAARAAVVVLPDDPFYYGDQQIDEYAGERRRQIELAARLVLRASNKVLADPEVDVEGDLSRHTLLTARVSARYHCFPGLGALVCGADELLTLNAEAALPYQGAAYEYE